MEHLVGCRFGAVLSIDLLGSLRCYHASAFHTPVVTVVLSFEICNCHLGFFGLVLTGGSLRLWMVVVLGLRCCSMTWVCLCLLLPS